MSVPADVAAPVAFPRFLARPRRGQPLLAATAWFLLLTMVPTAVAFGLDPRTLDGVSVWTKPLKFEASLAVHLLTVAWLMLCLPEEVRARRSVRGLAWATVAAALFEIAYIAFQAWRGEASHFNVATPAGRIMYALMGAGAVTLLAVSGTIGAMILRHGDTRDPIVFAAGLGLVLGSLAGGISGAYMSAQTGHWVGGTPTDLGGLPVVGWSRSGGDLRVAHFFGLHLAQALPIAAWAAARWSPAGARPATYAVAALGLAVTAATWLQAANGRPFVLPGL